MIVCRLCKERSADSIEHVFPDALGGHRKVRDFLCEKCNNELGKEIDSPLEEAFRPFSLLLGCFRGDKEPVAPLRGLDTVRGYKVALELGGRPVGAPTPAVQVLPNQEGKRLTFSISAESEEKAAWLLAHQCRRFKVKPDQLTAEKEEMIAEPVGTLNFKFSLGGKEQFRSVVKMALSALVAAWGRAFVDRDDLDPAAKFVLGGGESLVRAADASGRYTIRAFTGTNIGVHTLLVFDDPASGRAQVACAIFNAFVFRAEIGPLLGLGACTITHVVDPVVQTHRVETIPGIPSLAAISTVATDKTEAAEALRELVEQVREVQEKGWIDYAAEKAVEPLRSLPEGTLIQQEHLDAVVGEVMGQITQRMTGQRISKPLDSARVIEKAKALLIELEKTEK